MRTSENIFNYIKSQEMPNEKAFKELWLNYDKMRGVKNNTLGKRRLFEYQLWTKHLNT